MCLAENSKSWFDRSLHRKGRYPSVVPAHDIVRAFEKLQDIAPQEIDALLDYFENAWIGRPFRRGRRNPLFQSHIWTVYGRIQERLPRTNNSVEGWHRALQATLGHHRHPKCKLIEVSKLEQSQTENKLVHLNAGQHDQPNARYVRVSESSRECGCTLCKPTNCTIPTSHRLCNCE